MTDTVGFRDKFGFLFLPRTINFDGGRIVLIEDYNKNKEWIEERMDPPQKYLFPPINIPKATRKKPESFEFEEISGAERSAHLWKLPASHELRLEMSGDMTAIRMGKGGLILYLLSYLCGTRLQFTDWWVDRRLPIRAHNIGFDIKTIEQFLSHACRTWDTWPHEQQTWFINILYMSSRSPSYEWHWEQFVINYMVFDACFALTMKLRPDHEEYWKKYCKKKYHNKNIPHKARFEVMCMEHGIPFEEKHIEDIYKLRNPLFHQGLLHESMPGMGEDPIEEAYNLRRLNYRLIPALLNYPTDYIKTSWSSISRFWFDFRMKSNEKERS